MAGFRAKRVTQRTCAVQNGAGCRSRSSSHAAHVRGEDHSLLPTLRPAGGVSPQSVHYLTVSRLCRAVCAPKCANFSPTQGDVVRSGFFCCSRQKASTPVLSFSALSLCFLLALGPVSHLLLPASFLFAALFLIFGPWRVDSLPPANHQPRSTLSRGTPPATAYCLPLYIDDYKHVYVGDNRCFPDRTRHGV